MIIQLSLFLLQVCVTIYIFKINNRLINLNRKLMSENEKMHNSFRKGVKYGFEQGLKQGQAALLSVHEVGDRSIRATIEIQLDYPPEEYIQ